MNTIVHLLKIMTSITRELKNPDSPLSRWFESKMLSSGHRLIENHNQQMDRGQIIRPTGEIKNFSLQGTAFIYAFRWHLGLLHRRFGETPANYNLSSNISNKLLGAKTTHSRAIACLIFAAYEQQYRSGNLDEIATVLMKSDAKKLKPNLDYVSTMVDDLGNLIDSIPSVWDNFVNENASLLNNSLSSNGEEEDSSYKKQFIRNAPSNRLRGYKCFLNPTFAGSHYINGDAQQIVNKMLIKCFTTLKERPMTKYHFWQQIAYVLMDWDDRYQIDKICWYYSRQKALFVYPLESLFKDLAKSRKEFRDFLIEEYDDNYNYDDYFGYLSCLN
jgi:hypothetical protein